MFNNWRYSCKGPKITTITDKNNNYVSTTSSFNSLGNYGESIKKYKSLNNEKKKTKLPYNSYKKTQSKKHYRKVIIDGEYINVAYRFNAIKKTNEVSNIKSNTIISFKFKSELDIDKLVLKSNETDMNSYIVCSSEIYRYIISKLSTQEELDKLCESNSNGWKKRLRINFNEFSEEAIGFSQSINIKKTMVNDKEIIDKYIIKLSKESLINISMYHFMNDKLIKLCRSYFEDEEDNEELDKLIPKDNYYLLLGYNNAKDYQCSCTGSLLINGNSLESPKDCAIREINEETNLDTNDKIRKLKINDSHIVKSDISFSISNLVVYNYIISYDL